MKGGVVVRAEPKATERRDSETEFNTSVERIVDHMSIIEIQKLLETDAVFQPPKTRYAPHRTELAWRRLEEEVEEMEAGLKILQESNRREREALARLHVKS